MKKYKNPKKILLINPKIDFADKGMNESVIYPPLGLGYLASYLRKYSKVNSYDIKILDAHILKYDNNKVMEIIKSFAPDIVGIQLNLCGENGIHISKAIKLKYPDILVCIGGCIVSSATEECLGMSDADIAIYGEGETTFLEICEGNEYESIKGIVYKKNKKYIRNIPRPLIKNIDRFPHPAFDLLPDFKNYRSWAREFPSASIITSRGCPFHCTFCNSNIFGKRFRSHSPEYVSEEIGLLVDKFGIKQVDIMDDNFTLDLERTNRILDLIIKEEYNIKIALPNGIRSDCLTEEIVYKMKKAGVYKVVLSVESANKDILKSIRKSLDLNKVLQAVKWFKKYKIIIICNFILGFKDDTEETINESIDFAIKMNPTQVFFVFLQPLIGTEIYNDLKKDNCLKYPNSFFSDSSFTSFKTYVKGNLSEHELIRLRKKAIFKFYFRFSKIFSCLYNIRSKNELRWWIRALFITFKNTILK